MKNQELYHKTIDILVKAYLNDTLTHGNCRACAVGNIFKEEAIKRNIKPSVWSNHFVTINKNQQVIALEGHALRNNWGTVRRVHLSELNEEARNEYYAGLDLIKSSGYTLEELAKIEFAFETNGIDMYNGLMAVVEVLGQIHEADKETIQESKLMFAK